MSFSSYTSFRSSTLPSDPSLAIDICHKRARDTLEKRLAKPFFLNMITEYLGAVSGLKVIFGFFRVRWQTCVLFISLL